VWLKPDGEEMGERDWFAHYVRTLGMLLNGQVMQEWSERGEIVFDDPLLVLLNAYWEPLPFVLPQLRAEGNWRVLIDTAQPGLMESEHPSSDYRVAARSVVVLVLPESRVQGGLRRPISSGIP
jgi:isoamylase